MPTITNLTNTRWLINEIPVYDQYCEARGSIDDCWWRVDFYATTVDSSANRFNSLSLTNYRSDPVPADIGMMVYSKTSGADAGVYDLERTPHWYQGDEMRTITITGGQHVEDTNLINWLGANATLVPANLVIAYNSEEVERWSPHTLNTAGKLMSDDVVITSLGGGGVDPSDATAVAADIREGETAYIATGKTVGTMPDVTPTFNGGGVNPTSATITITTSRATVSDTNISGVIIAPGVNLSFERSSVTYGSTVTGYIDKAENTVALSATSATFSVDTRYTGQTFCINGVTVPSGKTFTVDNNGIVNINGGNADRGVQVNGKVAIVDQYTVTDNNGDLLVPTYNTTTYEIVYPSAFSVGSATQQGTLSGNVTSINGAIIEDSEAVHGSGSAGTSISYNLAKISSAKVLANGAKVTYSGATPSNPSTGDIWLQIIS